MLNISKEDHYVFWDKAVLELKVQLMEGRNELRYSIQTN